MTTTAATLQTVCLFRTVPQQQWPGALCLETDFIIPQALGVSAAAQSLQILQAVVVPSLFMKTTPQCRPLLTWQLIQGGPLLACAREMGGWIIGK